LNGRTKINTMKKLKISGICLGAALVSLVICGYTLQNKISVQAEVLTTKAECVAAFGKKGRKLCRRLFKSKKNKIYPIKCTIQNNGSSAISLSLENIDLKMVPRKTIVQKIACSNFNWLRGLKILGLGAGIFIGCTGIGLVGGLSMLSFAAGAHGTGCPCCILIPLCFTTGIGACVGAVAAPAAMVMYNNKNNKQTNKTFSLNFLNSLDIQPGETRIFFLFVYERDMQKNFSMKFTDENQNNLSYNVQLPSIVI